MTATTKSSARKKDNAGSKQQQILKVASAHFLRHGYDGASINAMARDSRISKESIYRYFDSKNDLFMAVIDQELAQYKQKITHLMADSNLQDIRESLLKVAETLLTVLLPDRQQAVRRLIFNEIGRTPEIGSYYFKIGPTLAYENLKIFFSAVHEKSDFPAEVLSRNFAALVLHGIMLERACGVRATPSESEITELAAPLVDDFLKAYFHH
jgi:TetR/AcrR family transcriptional regulator, mexJK operon transcriptional repressor